MPREVEWNQIIIAVLALGALALSWYYIYSAKMPEESTLDVTGTAKMMVDPDKVEIYITTETVNESANFSQHSNAIIMQEIKSALADVGVNANEIETVAYYLYPVKEYDKDGNVILSGYKTVHSVKITSYDLNKAGAIIDTVVAAGANRIDSVVFGLTDEKRDKYKAIVVNSSIDNAKQKAESMAMRMGVRVTKVKHFSESSVYISPYPRFEKDFFTAAPSTEITPGQIEVSASIEVVYKIE